MKDNHIPFEKLSDFFDEDISIEEERRQITGHLDECFLCKTEMDRLRNTIFHCTALRDSIFCTDGFNEHTMKVIRWRKRRKSFIRVIPAVAASVVILGGINFFSGALTGPDSGVIVSSSGTAAVSDTEKVVDILSTNRAKILKVSDLYIEGEVSADQFQKLRRELGFRKVVYNVVNRSSSDSGKMSKWNSNIEEVGTLNSSSIVGASQFGAPVSGSRYVRFRVFK